VSFRYTIRLSGAGGHGLIQAARILAEAAAIYDDNNAAESCSYGPEARGSASRAEVIISDEAIDYPKVKSVDLLMASTQEAFDRYAGDVRSDGCLVVDNGITVSEEYKAQKVLSVPFTEIAEEECGTPGMINMVALGCIAKLTDIIHEKSIRHAILARVPRMLEDDYIRAYEAGLKAATELWDK